MLADAAGIHRDTLYEWLKDPTFSDTLRMAYGRGVDYVHSTLLVTARTNPQAARFLLEQFDRQQYGRRLTIGIEERTSLVETFMEIMVESAREIGLDPEQRERLAASIGRRSSARMGAPADEQVVTGKELQLARQPAME